MHYSRYYHHIVILILSSLPFSAGAQIFFGIKAGPTLTYSALSEPDFAQKYETLPGSGWQTGMQVLFLPAKVLGLQAEVVYAVKRKVTRNRHPHDEINNTRLSYIDVPLIFRHEFGGRALKAYIGLGPELNFWIGGKGQSRMYDPIEGTTFHHSYNVHFGSYDNAQDQLNVQDANRLQMGFAFTTGFYWEVQDHNRITVDLRLSLGQTSLASGRNAEIPATGIVDSYAARNKTLSCAVAYLFQTGRHPYKVRRR